MPRASLEIDKSRRGYASPGLLQLPLQFMEALLSFPPSLHWILLMLEDIKVDGGHPIWSDPPSPFHTFKMTGTKKGVCLKKRFFSRLFTQTVVVDEREI